MKGVHALQAALHAVLCRAKGDVGVGIEGERRESHANSEVVQVDEEAAGGHVRRSASSGIMYID